jgi:hypothetical protein
MLSPQSVQLAVSFGPETGCYSRRTYKDRLVRVKQGSPSDRAGVTGECWDWSRWDKAWLPGALSRFESKVRSVF